MLEDHDFVAMVRRFPLRSGVFVLGPIIAVTVQFVGCLYAGVSLWRPLTFALVALGGSGVICRHHLAEFRVQRLYRESDTERRDRLPRH